MDLLNTRASSTSRVTVSPCRPATSRTPVEQAVEVAERIGYPVVVKAQVKVGVAARPAV